MKSSLNSSVKVLPQCPPSSSLLAAIALFITVCLDACLLSSQGSSKVGTISVFEEQPGGRCSRRGENKDQSSETESEATRAPQAIVRASAFPRSEMETLEGFE